MDKVKVQENTMKLIDFVSRKFEAGELDNDSLEEIYGVKFVVDNA